MAVVFPGQTKRNCDFLRLDNSVRRGEQGPPVLAVRLSPKEHMKTRHCMLTKCFRAFSFCRFNRVSHWLLLFGTAVRLAAGAEWPQFMGPNGDGTSAEEGLARIWP